jgi:hypothetical protein
MSIHQKEGTHLIICLNPKALDSLFSDESCCFLIAHASANGNPVECGDALVARDWLLEQGFKWGEDFYLKKL